METENYYKRDEGLELVDSSIADKIFEEEQKISSYYNDCYQSLPDDKLSLLRTLRPQIQQRVVQYIRGEIPYNDLREREYDFVKKKIREYEEFKEQKSNNPFILEVEGDYERTILDNLVKGQTMRVLEQEVNKKNIEEAQKIAERLGITKKNNN
ncbi:hypothetical protein M0R01_00480 [bacterium]|nr:hypothetical protein [bacterium]